MQSHQNWLKYWKNSLADAQRISLEINKLNHVILESQSLAEGRLPVQAIQSLFEKEEIKHNHDKGITDRKNKDWELLEKLNVLISVFTINPKPEHLQFLGTAKPIYPFWVSAVVMRSGVLEIPENYFPYIPRDYLSPAGNEETDYIFNTVEKVDHAAGFKLDELKTWDEYWKYIENVFRQITDIDMHSFEEESYLKKDEQVVVVQDEEKKASFSIIELYEHVLKQPTLPPLLKCLITLETPQDQTPIKTERYLSFHDKHIGQMGDEFPLSITQRKSLYTFLESGENTVFAVNGPPGTGKTTLLQSVVANKIVLSAIVGGDAPLILACSTNNQAVTNINESFSKTKSGLSPLLKDRWIPNFEGYATYLPSKSKSEQELKGTNFIKTDSKGTFEALENSNYIDKAKDHFLGMANQYLAQNYLFVSEAVDAIQSQIKGIQKEILAATTHWNQFVKAKNTIVAQIDFSKIEEEEVKKSTFWPTLKNQLEEIEKQTSTYFKKEPFFRKVLCWLGFSKALEKRKVYVAPIFREAYVQTQSLNFASKVSLLGFLNSAISDTITVINTDARWNKWKEQNGIKHDPVESEQSMWEIEYAKLKVPKSSLGYFYDEMDVLHRHKAFQLAIHYWEGRWIMAMDEILSADKPLKKTEIDQKKLWKIRAMLTSCFVSTFYMAPKFFSYYKLLGKRDDGKNMWETPPLLDFIDLLIVDESGQVSPEVGIATFSLAKNAMVVGDVKQIEPVWNITGKIDIGNLAKHGLLKNDRDQTQQTYIEKGFLASSGSIMRMAQNACRIVDTTSKIKERGMMLAEHRRCNDEIIQYCNELAYSGMLRPMKGKAKKEQLFLPMLLIHVEGNSEVKNKDRFNLTEVKYIVQWLLQNKEAIEKYYAKPKDDKYPTVEELVGIVTPFKGQKKLLASKLKEAGFSINKMKVGTVHSLQGAEREIVLFSPVYGEGDTGTMFFDRDNKPNMLNVAVSRAKDSFIVMGNKRIFNPASKTPSGILRKFLKEPLLK